MLPNDKTNQGARPAASTPRTHPIDSDLIVTGERQQPRFEKKERQQPLFLMMFLLSCVIFQIDGPCQKKKGSESWIAELSRAAPRRWFSYLCTPPPLQYYFTLRLYLGKYR
jgi:hypothetical protein